MTVTMFYKTTIFIISFILFCSLFGCKKSASGSEVGPADVNSSIPVDVYLAGAVDGTRYAYWKNGIASVLDSAFGGGNFTIAVAGDNVYSGGSSLLANGKPVPTYWKNGIYTKAIGAPSGARELALAISGDDVYMVGTYIGNTTGDNVAVYWKNGVKINLVSNDLSSCANAITIVGSDVYIAGYSRAVNGQTVATYWKNGVATQVKDNIFSVANAIAVNGADIYLAGYTNDGTGNFAYTKATYWKNNTTSIIGPLYSEAFGIAVNNNNIYMAGFVATPSKETATYVNSAAYWKNGTVKILGSLSTAANTIAVVGQDVYISGSNTPGSNGYWKNEGFVKLQNCIGVEGMVIVPK
jgi:hypothetical protein